ncbi:hypothetical protein I4U23_025974 [Adineta vaga]|nr:hypothetical protein I4U23_025974 [Adineta vaga]
MINGKENHANLQVMNKNLNPCANGGSFVTQYSSCQCLPGWAGDLCDYPDTSTNICPVNLCSNGGTCTILSSGRFRCNCPPSFTGLLCETGNVILSACTVNPCRNGGVCVSHSSTSFSCQCAFGWAGYLCDYPNRICARCSANTDSTYCKCMCTLGKKDSSCFIQRASGKM